MAGMLRSDLFPYLITYGKGLDEIEQRSAEFEALRQSLRKSVQYEQFYTLTDLGTRKIVWQAGVEQWLGHPLETQPIDPRDLPLMEHLDQYVHPAVKQWYRASLNAAILVLTDPQQPEKHWRVVINVPMYRKQDNERGEWMLVKMMATPLDRTKKGHTISILQMFTLVAPYKDEYIRVDLYEGAARLHQRFYDAMWTLLLECVRSPASTTPTALQLGIIRAIRALKAEGKDVSYLLIGQRVKGDPIGENSRNQINKATVDVSERLLGLLGLTANDIEAEPFFLRQADPVTIIHWLDQCGFITLLEAYMKKNYPKRWIGPGFIPGG